MHVVLASVLLALVFLVAGCVGSQRESTVDHAGTGPRSHPSYDPLSGLGAEMQRVLETGGSYRDPDDLITVDFVDFTDEHGLLHRVGRTLNRQINWPMNLKLPPDALASLNGLSKYAALNLLRSICLENELVATECGKAIWLARR